MYVRRDVCRQKYIDKSIIIHQHSLCSITVHRRVIMYDLADPTAFCPIRMTIGGGEAERNLRKPKGPREKRLSSHFFCLRFFPITRRLRKRSSSASMSYPHTATRSLLYCPRVDGRTLVRASPARVPLLLRRHTSYAYVHARAVWSYNTVDHE